MSTTTIFPFDTPGNYTYDSASVEITGGYAQLLSRHAADVTFAANFNTNSDGTFGGGTLTATETGTPVVAGGYVLIESSELVEYPGDDGNLPTNTGAIKVLYQPQYSGTPAANQQIVEFDPTSGNNNSILFRHANNGELQLLVYDSAGVAQVTIVGAWSPTAGTDYVLEANFSSGESRIFVNGTQLGSTNAGTYSRTNSAGIELRLGGGGLASNFKLGHVFVYNAVQHTANHTASSTDPYDTDYDTTNPTVLTTTAISGGIKTFAATEVTSGSDAIKYVLRVAGVDKYWNGTAWATSTGYAQSNTADEINTYCEEYNDGQGNIYIKAYLHSADGTTTPQLDGITVTYVAADTAATEPTLAYVQGYLYDNNGPVNGYTVEVRPYVQGFVSSEVFHIHAWATLDTTNAAGFFGGFVHVDGTNKWEFRIANQRYWAVLPNQEDIKFWDLELNLVT